MARRKISSEAAAETPAESTTEATEATETPVRRRRRRRSTVIDHAAQTAVLIEAVLKSRGGRGASQDSLQNVISWARGVHAEADALKALLIKPRRYKATAPAERLAAYEMNRALLEGVLESRIGIDVTDDGKIVFLTPEAGA